MLKKLLPWRWPILAGLALLLRWILPAEAIEVLYARGLFVGIRWMWDYTLGWFPFPVAYFFAFFLLIYIVRSIYRLIRELSSRVTWIGRVRAVVRHGLSFVSFFFFFFMLLWGFNYGRVPLVDQLDLQLAPLNRLALQEELAWTTKSAQENRSRIALANDTIALPDSLMPKGLDRQVRRQLVKTLMDLGYGTPGSVNGRILPSGWLMRWGISGIYLPFSGEGHIDGGQFCATLPFVIAHEMSHGYGHGDEGDCNFLALLACRRSDLAFVRYSGDLAYLRSILRAFRLQLPDAEYKVLRSKIPMGIQKDLDAVNLALNAYPEAFSGLAHVSNNVYLKSQGVKEGVESYEKVLLLARAWRLQKKDEFFE